jgi:prepilin-type N-terminal cleavage/methylation domain-containing protein
MKRERGFTLIELLVVISILAVLFGVTALALSGLSDGSTETAAAELDVVQTAVDVWLTQNSGTALAPEGTATTVGPTTPQFGTYLRRVSACTYTWDADGLVAQGTCN